MVVAVKTIKKALFDAKPDLQRKVRREIALMQLTSHPHLLQLIEVYESPKHLHMVLEYAEHGELFDYLVARRRLELRVAINFFRQLIYGLDYLHKHFICHRDLKPENILLDQFDQLKIADFGFARWMRGLQAETSCGSPHYASPEVIRGAVYDGRAADMWSCGVILYALLAGRLPFDDPSIRTLLSKVKSGRYSMPEFFDPRVRDLISGLLELDPDLRLSVDAVKVHPAFRIGFPDEYQVPMILPVPSFQGPVPLQVSDGTIVSVLRSIGYASDAEVAAELQAEEPTPAKTFYFMWKASISFDALPWGSGAMELTSAGPGACMVSPVFGSLGATVGGARIDQFGRRPGGLGSPGSVPQSLTERATWLSDVRGDMQEGLPEDSIVDVQVPGIQLEFLMAVLQQWLEAEGCRWLHTSDQEMFVKSLEPVAYVSLRAERVQAEQCDVILSLQEGDSTWFQAFVSEFKRISEQAQREFQVWRVAIV